MGKYVKYPENLTLTFVNGILETIEKPRNNGLMPTRYRVKDIQFLDDLSTYLKSRRLPMLEMMQWINKNNKSINLEIVDGATIKLYNINL